MIQEQPDRDCSSQFRIHFGSTVADLTAAFAAFDAQERVGPSYFALKMIDFAFK